MASSSVEFNKNFDGNSRNLKWTESIATIASLVLPGASGSHCKGQCTNIIVKNGSLGVRSLKKVSRRQRVGVTSVSGQAHQKRLGITNSFCAENIQEDHCWAALDKSPIRIRPFSPCVRIRREKFSLRPSFWQLILASRRPHRSKR